MSSCKNSTISGLPREPNPENNDLLIIEKPDGKNYHVELLDLPTGSGGNQDATGQTIEGKQTTQT